MALLCSARLQHLEKEGQLADRGSVEEQLRSAVLQPDTSLARKALVELGKATTLCMAVEAQHVLLAPDKKVRSNSQPSFDKLSQQVKPHIFAWFSFKDMVTSGVDPVSTRSPCHFALDYN